MLVTCTVWFALHTVIGFRTLMGETPNDDWLDLAALELVFAFPGLILHTVLLESHGESGIPERTGRWSVALIALYGAGAAMAIYFPGAIFGILPAPASLNPLIGLSIGSLFTASSLLSIFVMMSRRRRTPTTDQRRLRSTMIGLFAMMIAIFLVLTFVRERIRIIEVLNIFVRATPLMFLLVSVYFQNRFEFYDLVIKRGVLLLLSLVILAGMLALNFLWIDHLPPGMTRAWLFAVLLLPVAMLLPGLHAQVGRLLDRLWFGREFTPVAAVKHVLGAMQQATDEPSLVAATEATLSDIFRRRIAILQADQPLPDGGGVSTEVRLPGTSDPVQLVVVNESGSRPMLSEDHALLKSLGGVFGFMLENVRLQRRRVEQEQVAQELRLQTSRSELKALRAQINPHFLFNALNAIASLIHTDPARADAAVEQLAEVFRYTLRRSDQEWAPLDQELAFARAYLDVEQARFGRRLEFTIDADAGLSHVQVPSMLLQTLVENAVKHGIAQLRTPGRIDVRAARNGAGLRLEVRDSGPGPGASGERTAAAGEGFGLRSVRDRLRGHFGARGSIDLSREGDTTIARIQMPLVEQTAPVGSLAR
jgi:two-component system LytT family sensor kinase